MKVVAVNGSARKGGNTTMLIEAVFEPLRAAGHDCELIELARETSAAAPPAASAARRPTASAMVARTTATRSSTPLRGRRDHFGQPDLLRRHHARDQGDHRPRRLRRRAATAIRWPASPARPSSPCAAPARSTPSTRSTTSSSSARCSSWARATGTSASAGPGRVAEDAEGMATMRRLGENMAWALARLRGSDPGCDLCRPRARGARVAPGPIPRRGQAHPR